MNRKNIKIGNVEVKGNLILAPMAGLTDLPFREICRTHGADLVYSEMVSAKGIVYGSENTFELTKTSDIERPVTLQIFGSEPQVMAEAAKQIEDLPFDILDINMGCPAPKIIKNGDGSALLDEPKKIGEIVKAVSSAISKPLTIKIRKGINGKDSYLEAAKYVEDNGGAAIALHGRTREQYYEGNVDLEAIAKVKEALTIPVFSSGDVVDIASYKKTMEITKADGIMIGRGALGNPWIFNMIRHYEATGEELPEPSMEEKFKICLYHAKQLIAQKGEYTAIREMRKHTGWYIKGIHGAAAKRKEINQIESYEDLELVLNSLL